MKEGEEVTKMKQNGMFMLHRKSAHSLGEGEGGVEGMFLFAC